MAASSFEELVTLVKKYPEQAQQAAHEWAKLQLKYPELYLIETESQWGEWRQTHQDIESDVFVGKQLQDVYLDSVGEEETRLPQQSAEGQSHVFGQGIFGGVVGGMGVSIATAFQCDSMEDDPRFKRIEEQLKKEWLQNNPGKTKGSQEFYDFAYGSLTPNTTSPTLKLQAGELFRKDPKNQKRLVKYNKVYSDPATDPAILKRQQLIKDITQKRLVLLKTSHPEIPEDSVKSSIERNIWNEFINLYPEKAKAYAKQPVPFGVQIKIAMKRAQFAKLSESSKTPFVSKFQELKKAKEKKENDVANRLARLQQMVPLQTPVIAPAQPFIAPQEENDEQQNQQPQPQQQTQNPSNARNPIDRANNLYQNSRNMAKNLKNLSKSLRGISGLGRAAASFIAPAIPYILAAIGIVLLIIIIIVVVLYILKLIKRSPVDTTVNDVARCTFYNQGREFKIGNPDVAAYITQVSSQTNVPPDIIAAVLARETEQFLRNSSTDVFNNDYYHDPSNPGVTGAMQIKNSTFTGTYTLYASEITTKFNKTFNPASSLDTTRFTYDPNDTTLRIVSIRDSVMIGAYYLKDLKQGYDASAPWTEERVVREIAGRYHGGPERPSCTNSYCDDVWRSVSSCRASTPQAVSGSIDSIISLVNSIRASCGDTVTKSNRYCLNSVVPPLPDPVLSTIVQSTDYPYQFVLQCVGFVQAATTYLGYPNIGLAPGGAASGYAAIPPSTYNWIPNNPTAIIQPGDIPVWNASLARPWGHVAIAVSVYDQNRFKVADANVGPGGRVQLRDIVKPAEPDIAGWLRKK